MTVYLRTANDAVELSVEDSGPGIAEDQISQAMLPFHRLETG